MPADIESPFTLEQLDLFSLSVDDLAFSLDSTYYNDPGTWIRYGDAAVTSDATIVATAYKEAFAAASVSCSSTVTADAIKVKLGGASISSSADVSANATRVRLGNASIDSSADVSASGIRFRESIAYPANYLAFGNAQISTAQYKFGSSSLALDGSGDYVRSPTNLGAFENSDYTVELWVRPNSSSSSSYIFDHRQGGGVSLRTSSTSLWVGVSGFIAINIANAFPTPQIWYHIAITRSGNNTKCYIDGVQKGSTYTTAYTASAANLFIGAPYFANSTFLNGYIDEFRISNSVRYSTTFTPPTGAFTYDSNTLVLLQFEGANGSTTIANSLPADTPSISGIATISASGNRTRVINTPQEITANVQVEADALRARTNAGAIISSTSVSCLGSFEFSGFADIFCEASVTASAGQTFSAVAYINVNGEMRAIGYIYGEEWDLVPSEANTWSDASVGLSTWTDSTVDTNTWTEVSAGSNTWTTISSGNNTWQRVG